MNTSTPFVPYLGCTILALALAACSDEPPEPAQAKKPPVAATPAPTGAVTLEPRYEATLAEGVDFARPGYPAFLKEVQGMSGHEPWGRWTDATVAPTARFRFVQPLPDRFTLELRAYGLGPNAFHPVKIRVGAIEKSITLGDPPKDSYRIAFDGTKGADQIEITPPAPILPREVTPQNLDPRKLGVGLKSLKILN